MHPNGNGSKTKRKHVDLDEFWRSHPAQFTVGFASAKAKLEERLRTGIVPGYKTGINVLDEFIRLVPREYTLIGARSGSGKTALGMQLIDAVEEQRRNREWENSITVMFSAEMDKETLASRHAAKVTGIPQARINSEYATDDEIRQHISAMEEAARYYGNVWIDESSAPTLQHMVDQLAILQEEWTIALVLFDYIELSGEGGNSENLRIAAISRGMKAISKKFDCPTVGLSQLNRDIEKRADKMPRMSDIMYGGEREPDRILLLSRSEDQDKRTDGYIVKNRNGPLGQTVMLFDGARMTFSSATVKSTPLNGAA
jgi:replicative DNA helicase